MANEQNATSYPAHHYWVWIIAIFFSAAGANHFANPEPYIAMMPAGWPAPAALVIISGIAEIAGGIGLLFKRTRVLTGWLLIALLVAVFPANLNVALHGWPGVQIPAWSLWARLPLQLLFIWWVHRICVRAENRRATASLLERKRRASASDRTPTESNPPSIDASAAAGRDPNGSTANGTDALRQK